MAFCVDFQADEGHQRVWSFTADGAVAESLTDYTPTVYLAAGGPPDEHALTGTGRERLLSAARDHLGAHPAVEALTLTEARRAFEHDSEPVLRVDVSGVDSVRSVARAVRGWEGPGTYRCFNVDLSPEFRVCLETDRDPVPPCPRAQTTVGATAPGDTADASRSPAVTRPLRECTLAVPPGQCSAPVRTVAIDDERVSGPPRAVIRRVSEHLRETDPDVLRVNRSAVVPELFEAAEAVGADDFALGRRPGYRQRATESTYESYGRVGHSPARYGVPGRVVIDERNTFFLDETNLAGCLDLVRRSRKPLQELAWASIGNVLTAIQVREARRRGVLVPWRAWRHEQFKSMGTLHDADRGGFTFTPDVGVHEDVHEVDFASLYPNIIVTRNVSPDTIRCSCHDRADVPEVDYSVCDERGFLPDVLEPIVEARSAIKEALAKTDDPKRESVLEGRSSALKWILVSCFGYQGFSNAKYGRIECHEAINAYAREILLDAKAVLERNGWRVVHGIVDSLWVTPVEGETQVPLRTLCAELSDDIGIRLEYEQAFDWVAFCPTRDGSAGALTRYFGRRSDVDPDGSGEAYKFRGVECRQDDTPAFVAETQAALIGTFDETRDPEAVIGRLQTAISQLRTGQVAPTDLATEKRVSKRLEQYQQQSRTVAALSRAQARDRPKAPGQRVEYVVVDDDRRDRDRVRLASEGVSPDQIDTGHYEDLLVRACASVLGPLGWSASDVQRSLADRVDSRLAAF